MRTTSIGIRKWAGDQALEFIKAEGCGDAKIVAWRRDDGEIALETNGDPVFGAQAVAWVEAEAVDAAYRFGEMVAELGSEGARHRETAFIERMAPDYADYSREHKTPGDCVNSEDANT